MIQPGEFSVTIVLVTAENEQDIHLQNLESLK